MSLSSNPILNEGPVSDLLGAFLKPVSLDSTKKADTTAKTSVEQSIEKSLDRASESSSLKLGFLPTEHYGSGISVKMIDFASKEGANPPFKSTFFEVLPGYTTPVDQHKVEECWLVLSGSGILECDGERVQLKQHDIVHFASFKGHSVWNNSSAPLLLCSIYW